MKKLLVVLLVLLLWASSAAAAVNVLSGHLTLGQDLFSAQGGSMALGVSLSYNSYDALGGPFGPGWTHSYEIYLHPNSDGTMVFTGGQGKRFYFPDGNGGYFTRAGDFSTLTANADGTFTLNFPDGAVYRFGSNRKVASIADRFSNALTFDYSVADQVTVSDPANRQVIIHTDANGRINWIKNQSTDPAEKQYDFSYSTAGMLESISYPAPDPAAPTVRPEWNYLYTSDNKLEFLIDPEGHISKHVYTNGKCTRVVYPEGVVDTGGTETADAAQYTKSFAFDTPAAGETTLTEKDGGQWIYSYDVNEGVLTAKQDPNGNVTSYVHYGSSEAWPGLRKSVTTPIDADTVYVTEYLAYDAQGNAIETRGHVRHLNGGTPIDDPADRHMVMTYGTYDRLTFAEDKITGAVTTMDYVAGPGTGEETVIVTAPKIDAGDVFGPQSVLVFNADGQLDLVTDPLGRQIDYAYDAAGLLHSATDLSSGIVSTFGDLDAMGRPQLVSVAAGSEARVTHVVYDNLGRATTVTRDGEDPQTQALVTYVTSFGYDLLGNRTRVTDAENNSTTFEHNARGQVTRITDDLSQVTELLYGGAGCASCGGGVDKLTDVINANHYNPGTTAVPKSSFRYDTVGRVKSESDENGNTRLYAYDAAGRLLDLYQDGVGVAGNVPGEIDPADTHLLHYVWSGAGELSSKTDQLTGETTTFTYYPLPTPPATDFRAGRLKTATNPAASYTFDYYANGWLKSSDDGITQIEHAYDAAGRRELVTVKQDGAPLQTLDYVYNATSKRLENIVSAAGTFTFGYDAWGRRGSLLYPNGVNAVYSYHGDMDWLTGIDYQGLGLTIGYPQHDKAGNRKQRTEALAPEGAVATDYAFDATYQLTQAKTGAGEENYVYDKVGNRQSGPTVKDTAAAAYDHDAANRMLQGRKFTYAYDPRGNQSRKYLSADQTKRWEFTWDGENRLREAKVIADAATLRTVTFKYDPFGRRVRKEVQGLAPQVPVPLTTTYTYDGEDIVLQFESDGTTATTTKYVHGPGIDEPLAMLRDGASFSYHADGLGSVVAVSDGNKSIVAKYGYDAFGMVSASDPAFANAYAYTGREWDKEIGLYYYRARYYDPMEGRFISRDPIGFAGGDVNLYAYVGNRPINWIDPWGLKIQRFGRAADLPIQVDHHWLKTDKYEGGMGPMDNRVPGQEGQSSLPFDPTQMTDHSGQSLEQGAFEIPILFPVNEECVNSMIKAGTPTGRWTPVNQCQSTVDDILDKCRQRGASGGW
jgi:RHS repeat-associated protein